MTVKAAVCQPGGRHDVREPGARNPIPAKFGGGSLDYACARPRRLLP